MDKKITIFWFRRDLRIEDNVGFSEALKSGFPVLPIFIFDKEILDKLTIHLSKVKEINEDYIKVDNSKKGWFY